MRISDDQAPEVDGLDLPSLLVVGSEAAGKLSLVRKLVKREDPQVDASSAHHRWSVQTKYYTAEVAINIARLGGGGALPSAAPEGVEAVMMVVDLTNPESFGSVQKWVASASLDSAEVRLLVGNKADRAALPPGTEGRAHFLEWCVDNGVEYIEACAVDEEIDAGLSWDGDQQGIARIRSALSAHMWSGMILKAKPKMEAKEVLPGEGVSSGEEDEGLFGYEQLPDGPRVAMEGSNITPESEDVPEAGPSSLSSEEPPIHSSSSPSHSATEREAALAVETPPESLTAQDTGPEVSHIGSTTIHEEVLITEHAEPASGESTKAMPEQPRELSEPSISNGKDAPVLTRAQVERDLKGLFTLEEPGDASKDPQEEGFDDFERLMFEMLSLRTSMQAAPDGQRKEMAERMAMRMAAMFGEEDE